LRNLEEHRRHGRTLVPSPQALPPLSRYLCSGCAPHFGARQATALRASAAEHQREDNRRTTSARQRMVCWRRFPFQLARCGPENSWPSRSRRRALRPTRTRGFSFLLHSRTFSKAVPFKGCLSGSLQVRGLFAMIPRALGGFVFSRSPARELVPVPNQGFMTDIKD
jgi:hypothetical protein